MLANTNNKQICKDNRKISKQNKNIDCKREDTGLESTYYIASSVKEIGLAIMFLSASAFIAYIIWTIHQKDGLSLIISVKGADTD